MKEDVRVILADDHEVVRLGLRTLLDDVAWVRVVAEAGNAEEAVRLAEEHRPDVVIMDIRMPGASGIDACREITSRFPDVRVIMLTSFGDDELILKALQAGASGYILKQVGNRSLVSALEAVREGNAALDPQVTRQVIDQIRKDESARQTAAFRDLSPREMEVLAEVAKGLSNNEIAVVLNLSEKTVRNHVSAILTELGLSNRIEAATYAVRHDIERHLPGGDA
ncbi:MAG: response regulator transcription factor [Chloroflexota bacterium]|jgi:two-component system, NarL family, response regulator DevR